MLTALSFSDPSLLGEGAASFAERLVVYHARLAARAALNGQYNGRRPH